MKPAKPKIKHSKVRLIQALGSCRLDLHELAVEIEQLVVPDLGLYTLNPKP